MDGNSSEGNIYQSTHESSVILKAIKNLDVFLPNAMEARRLTGIEDLDAAIQRLGELCPLVIIKDGSRGSLAFSEGKISKVPGIPVTPIDTTGAGDNFNAGFLCAWLNEQPIDMCLKWGNIVGGLSTTESGGTIRKISCDEVNQYISEYHW